MRVFGKVLQTFQLSRSLSCSSTARRYSSTVCSKFGCSPSFQQNTHVVRNYGSSRYYGSKSGNSKYFNRNLGQQTNKDDGAGDDTASTKDIITTNDNNNSPSNILPVALIKSSSHNAFALKILLIPINLFEGDDEAAQKTLATIAILRENAKQIEAFAENLSVDPDFPSTSNFKLPRPKETTANKTILADEELSPDIVNENLEYWQNELANEKALHDDNALYNELEKVVAEQEIDRIQSHNAFDVIAWNDSKRHLYAYIPESLEEKLNKMAIASMQLAFEMNMTNIRDAILMGPGSTKIDMCNVPPPKSLKDPTLCLTTCLDMLPYKQQTTVPLNFNALIQGTVEIDSSKFSADQLREIKIPEFNDYMTTIAAHICSSALQKGFPADISRMSYSTQSTSSTSSSQHSQNPHIICLREGDKGSISPGNVDYPMSKTLSSGGSNAGSGKSSAGSKPRNASSDSAGKDDVPLLLSSAIIGDCGARGLMSCNAYAKALVEAAKRREEMKGKKSNKDCKKPAEKKSCKEDVKASVCKEETKESKKPTCKKSCEEKKESTQKKATPKCTSSKPKEANKETKACKSAAAPDKKPSKDKPKCEDPKPPKCTPHEPKLPCGPPDEVPAKPNKNCGAQKAEKQKCDAAPKEKVSCQKEKKESKPKCPSKDSKSEKKCATPSPCRPKVKKEASCDSKVDKPKCVQPKPCQSAQSKKPCVEASSKKKDKNKDKCNLPDPCKDPCAKDPPKKKEKPCKEVEEPPCKKIKSPCPNAGGSKCKKIDPKSCKSESKGSLSLAKKDDKCSSKKQDPCKSEKKSDKKDPCKSKKSEKKDPCKDKKSDPCKDKKPDPCKEKSKCGSEKKQDKCASDKKKDKCGGNKKEEKKQDKCAADKKKDKCGGGKKEEKKQDKCAADKKKDKCGGDKKAEKKKDPCNPPEKKKEESAQCNTEDPCKGMKKSEKEPESKCSSGSAKGVGTSSTSSSSKSRNSHIVCVREGDKGCVSPGNADYPMFKGSGASRSDSGSSKTSPSKCDSGRTAKKEKVDPCTKKDTKSVCRSNKKKSDACGKKKSSDKNESGCGQKKKDTKPVCKKDKGDSCKKSYSTSAVANWNRDVFWSIKRNISTSLIGSLRNFSSKKKESDGDGKCSKAQSKIPEKRKTVKRKDNQKCFNVEECPRVSCKDPKDSSCGDKDKKENKNSRPRGIFTTTCKTRLKTKQKKYITSHLLQRYFGTSTVYRTRFSNHDDDDDEYDYERSDDMPNEVVKIIDACTVERVCEKLPNFSDYDVLIRTAAVAISGSDIHVYETGGKACPGMTIGHDAAGIIEKVGKCIYCLKPGDRVAIESGLSCGICDFCKRGAYNMCSQLIYNGFLSTFQVHPADLCHKLPNNLTMEEGSLTQTLALGCQACFKAHITPTTNVLVIGSSATAISAALCARAFGAKNVCIASSMQNALEASRELYSLESVHYDCAISFGEALEGIFCVMNDWPDVVINCAISETTMNLAVMALQPCGTCILAECEAECACFNALDVLMKNLRLVPSFRSTNMFPTALQMMQSGRAPICQLIARVFGWQQVATAFRSAQHESNVGNRKVIVKCAEEENSKESKT